MFGADEKFSTLLPLKPRRRALDFLPTTRCTQRTPFFSQHNDIARQLSRLQSDAISCCLTVASEIFQSRAAILLLRGRVLACVYGDKQLPHCVYGREAYEIVLRDINRIDNRFDCYELAEPLILAAGSMFRGQRIQCSGPSQSAFDFLKFALSQFDEYDAAGSVLLTEGPRSGTLYFFKRTLLDVHFSIGNANTLKIQDTIAVHEDVVAVPPSSTEFRANMLSMEYHNVMKELTFGMKPTDSLSS